MREYYTADIEGVKAAMEDMQEMKRDLDAMRSRAETAEANYASERAAHQADNDAKAADFAVLQQEATRLRAQLAAYGVPETGTSPSKPESHDYRCALQHNAEQKKQIEELQSQYDTLAALSKESLERHNKERLEWIADREMLKAKATELTRQRDAAEKALRALGYEKHGIGWAISVYPEITAIQCTCHTGSAAQCPIHKPIERPEHAVDWSKSAAAKLHDDNLRQIIADCPLLHTTTCSASERNWIARARTAIG